MQETWTKISKLYWILLLTRCYVGCSLNWPTAIRRKCWQLSILLTNVMKLHPWYHLFSWFAAHGAFVHNWSPCITKNSCISIIEKPKTLLIPYWSINKNMKLIICTRHSSPKYQLSILISLNSFISFRYFEWTDRTFASRVVSYEVTSRSGEQKKVQSTDML